MGFLPVFELQGTKACLGWDRDPEHGTYACTAVTDSWLLLLQRALHAARALQTAAQNQSLSSDLRRQGSAPFERQQSIQPTQQTGAVANAGRAAASYVGALQELLDQLLNHWQVCIPLLTSQSIGFFNSRLSYA